MSGTVCCWKGCDKSYSNDKDVVVFFKFPDDPKRRKKWMENCSNSELTSLSDRQLRLKRVCADHFSPTSFISAETRNQLTERAVPLSQKEADAARASAKILEESQQHAPKRGRGRPPKASLSIVKKDKKEIEEEYEEDDYEKDDNGLEDFENGDEDIEYAPPPMLKKQIKQDNEDASTALKGKFRPPKLVAVSGKDSKTEVTKVNRRKSLTGSKRMADLSVIDDVVKHIRIKAQKLQAEEDEKERKKNSVVAKEIVGDSKLPKHDPILMALVDDSDDEDSADDDDDEEDDEDDDELTSEEEEDDDSEGPERANREFERFQASVRDKIKMPFLWGMGGVIWDPLNKMKVMVISEPEVQANGTIRLRRAVQIFEDSTVKVLIDGVDMTLGFDVKPIGSEEDVGELVDTVANATVCTGIIGFEPDDIIYLPFAKKRGCKYYSEACPVVIKTPSDDNNVCNPCLSLQVELIQRKEKEKQQMDHRRANPAPENLKNEFGQSIYGLLHEILDDAEQLKSDRKQDRDAVLSKYSNELSVMNGEIHKPEKIHHMGVSVDEVSASFQDIVTKLGFSKKDGKLNSSLTNTPQPLRELIKKDSPSPTQTSSFPRINTKSVNISNLSNLTNNHVSRNNATSIHNASNSTGFSVLDGQEYEVIGEVEGPMGNEVVQMVDMSKSNKQDGIEIIEVDDETMAKLTASNPGLFFQQPHEGHLQVTVDSSDSNLSQILKSIDSTNSSVSS